MTDQLPLVTVVTPSFNQGEFIEATVRSVLDQDYPNVEYIVVDGGSTDTTLDVLRRFNGRVRWSSEPDAGQSDAISKGFERGRGEVLAWLNADDLYAPGAISTAVTALLANPDCGFVYGRAEFIDRHGIPAGKQDHHRWDPDYLLRVTNYIPQPATFFRREAYEAVGGLSLDLHYVMDYDLWIKLGRFGAVAIDDTLAVIRMYPDTKTSAGGLPRMAEMRRMAAGHGLRHLPRGHYWDLFKAHVRAGRSAWRDGNRRRAVRHFLRAAPCLARPMTLRQAIEAVAYQVR